MWVRVRVRGGGGREGSEEERMGRNRLEKMRRETREEMDFGDRIPL